MAEPMKKHNIAADKLQRLTACVMETDKGTIKLTLFPDAAPNTVANWHALATSGFYDGPPSTA
jgi:peptidyl-prolyl cis-trans isomerase A (cyclophilin A)/peptidyl-prolyl cis-trans isomerase B (cyclophilin B)